MEGLLILLGLWLFVVVFVFPIWAMIKFSQGSSERREIFSRLDRLEKEVRARLRVTDTVVQTITPPAPIEEPAEPVPPPPKVEQMQPPVEPPPTPPPFVPPPPKPQEPTEPQPSEPKAQQPPSPPPFIPRKPLPSVNWERFMGVNLFSWIGGFVLFLAAAFFVKYSIDNNLISPEIRIAIGFLVSAVLLILGLRFAKKEYRVTSHTLCATGIVILYADIFAAYSFYGFIGHTLAFLMMILATTTAFFLAARLNAKVVATLGLLGGFLTPILISAKSGTTFQLFGYIGFLDVGLIAILLRKRWSFLAILAAVGTAVMQILWVDELFQTTEIFVSMGIFFPFQALFLAAYVYARKKEQDDLSITSAAILLPFVTIGFLLYLLSFAELGVRPGILFTFALVSDICLLVIPLRNPRLHWVHRIAGIIIFLALTQWTLSYLSYTLLNWALGLYVGFAILHTVFPLVLQRTLVFQRQYPEATAGSYDHLFAPAALLLIMFTIWGIPEISSAIWFAVLLIDALAITVAFMSVSFFPVIGVLIITILTILVWLVRIPAAITEVSEFLLVTAGFATLFFFVGIFASRKILNSKTGWNASALAQLPALSAILPFLLLILAVIRLPLENPSPVFGLGLFLAILLLGLSKMMNQDLLGMIALISVTALEYFWHATHFHHDLPFLPLSWYLLFYSAFTVFPFLFSAHFRDRVLPWASSALSGPLHFYLVYNLLSSSFPNDFMGLLPAAFSLPPLLALSVRLRAIPEESNARTGQLAWYGGAALFFITLIFPIQFEHEWVLIGWALEGAALIWLFRRIPYPGLRIAGVGLLVVTFVGMIYPGFYLNRPRSTVPIFNWYLYTYGIAVASLIAGAKWLAPPHHKLGRLNLPPVLYTLGALLAFLLLNIEIADYYAEGQVLTFEFTQNFARDMTYSIAWACFAFVLLIVGIRKKMVTSRYASIVLLGITLIKLFLHDLARLQQLYRVGALVGVAIVLILASYLYQRFVSFEPEAEKEA